MKTILYCLASTDDQAVNHQVAQARAAGFDPDEVVSDDGASCVKAPLVEREHGRQLFDMLRSGDTLVVRWVDRLGRNYHDICDAIREFMRRGVVVRTVIDNLTFDGAARDPIQRAVRDALIGFMAALAEATKEVKQAGVALAEARQPQPEHGSEPSFAQRAVTVREMLVSGASTSEIAAATGLSRQAIYRIRIDPEWSEDRLAT